MRISLPLLALALLAGNAHAMVTLELKQESVVSSDHVMLADVVVPYPDTELMPQAGQVDLGAAPLPGYSDRLSRAQIERRLRARTGITAHIRWSGADSVHVVRRSAPFDMASVSKMARTAVAQQLSRSGVRIETSIAEPLPEISLPPGKVSVSVRPLSMHVPRPRMTVWCDIAVDGVFVRAVAVPVSVKAIATVLATTRPIDKGATPSCRELHPIEVDLSELPGTPVPSGCVQMSGRLKHRLPADSPLLMEDLEQATAVTEGDNVSLRLVDGALELQARAIALASGGIGQRIAVRPGTSNESIVAEVVAPGVVKVTGR